jgi:MerR family transcriptional regulator, light-induced transcriptional regulator
MNDEPHLPDAGLRINAVAEMSGLSVHTIRAWERRYGVPKPPRSTGRQRLYSRADVEALRRMHELSRSGVPLAEAARSVRQEQESGEPVRPAAPAPILPSLDAFVDALLRFDEARAAELWAAALAITDIESVTESIAIPALQRIGDGWHEGTVSVAQEHFASGFIRGRIEALARQHAVPRDAPIVLLACLPDDWHEVSLLILSIGLRARGLRTVYLGQSVPIDDLVRTVEDLQPRVVVLHGYSMESAEFVAEVVERTRERAPITAIVFGGRGFDDDEFRNIDGAHFGGDTVVDGTETIERLARLPIAGLESRDG